MTKKTIATTILGFCFLVVHAQKEQSVKKQDSSIYSFVVDSISGGKAISFANFKGKKILIVNSATLDSGFYQLQELKKLQRQQKGELVIILFPCNDFNTEPANDKQIALFLNRFQFPFVVAAKTHVKSKGISPLFQWLTNKKLNGVLDSEIKGAFQKYLINEKGMLAEIFLPGKRPFTDATVKSAIEKKQTGKQ
ncbi:MAG: glutathione peroxidase [Chitinophagaceae bacterium]|nr:glutathione peroxidase [Chitinophagaceae bacterium]